MQAKASVVAQKLINLYRQEHVITGGWSAVNQVFIAEATPDVIKELQTLPTGNILIRHIENLRSGKTPMNGIERELLPYGGMMMENTTTSSLTATEIDELTNTINSFTPDQSGLDSILQLNSVKKFGTKWSTAIRAALSEHPDLVQKWAIITQTYRAYSLWANATTMLNQPLSERIRAEIQADMPEFETYLPMFGIQGTELLEKLRNYIRTRDQI